jgi:hypothetical protein
MSTGTALPASTPRCAVHPDSAAGGTCPRCGSFFCPECTAPVLGVVHCAACAARPEVNYLEVLRQRFWGRRDESTWIVGAGSVLLLSLAVAVLPGKHWLLALCLTAWAAVGGAFFLGQPWARQGLLAAPGVLAVLGVPLAGRWVLAPLLFVFIIALAIHQDPRNQLFFRRELPPAKLQKLWHLHANNPLARYALSLATASLMMPLTIPVAIACAGVALQRVNPSATPPIGRRGQALLAIGLAVGSGVLWATVLWPLVRDAFLGPLSSV